MTITIVLTDSDSGTEVLAVREQLPAGLSPADNEVGWLSSLGKLAALFEGLHHGGAPRSEAMRLDWPAPRSGRVGHAGAKAPVRSSRREKVAAEALVMP